MSYENIKVVLFPKVVMEAKSEEFYRGFRYFEGFYRIALNSNLDSRAITRDIFVNFGRPNTEIIIGSIILKSCDDKIDIDFIEKKVRGSDEFRVLLIRVEINAFAKSNGVTDAIQKYGSRAMFLLEDM